jgi:hypothetical protein
MAIRRWAREKHAMTQGEEPDGTPTAPDPEGDQADPDHEPIPDDSGLLGRIGVEDELLAELARAEAKMSDPTAPEDPDAAGAQV